MDLNRNAPLWSETEQDKAEQSKDARDGAEDDERVRSDGIK